MEELSSDEELDDEGFDSDSGPEGWCDMDNFLDCMYESRPLFVPKVAAALSAHVDKRQKKKSMNDTEKKKFITKQISKVVEKYAPPSNFSHNVEYCILIEMGYDP